MNILIETPIAIINQDLSRSTSVKLRKTAPSDIIMVALRNPINPMPIFRLKHLKDVIQYDTSAEVGNMNIVFKFSEGELCMPLSVNTDFSILVKNTGNNLLHFVPFNNVIANETQIYCPSFIKGWNGRMYFCTNKTDKKAHSIRHYYIKQITQIEHGSKYTCNCINANQNDFTDSNCTPIPINEYKAKHIKRFRPVYHGDRAWIEWQNERSGYIAAHKRHKLSDDWLQDKLAECDSRKPEEIHNNISCEPTPYSFTTFTEKDVRQEHFNSIISFKLKSDIGIPIAISNNKFIIIKSNDTNKK
jgi:hypothetical protein